MRQQENTTPQHKTYSLSGNNSILNLNNGQAFDINIDFAFMHLIDRLPKEIELSLLRSEILGILDEFTENMPKDFDMGRYKVIYAVMNGIAEFHGELLTLKEGGNND